MNNNEVFLAFRNGLKSWVRHELKLGGVQELSKAMMAAKSVVKLDLRKDKLESSEFEERGYVGGTTMKIMAMKMKMVVIGNHKLGRGNPTN